MCIVVFLHIRRNILPVAFQLDFFFNSALEIFPACIDFPITIIENVCIILQCMNMALIVTNKSSIY